MTVRHILLSVVLGLGLAACATDGGTQPRTEGREAVALPDPAGPRRLYVAAIQGLQDQDKHRAALAYLDDYANRYGRDTETLLMRARSLLALDRLDDASRLYEELLSTHLAGAGHNGLGLVAARRGEWDAAGRAFGKAVALRPAEARFVGNLGFALLKLGRAEEAEFRLLQAHELDPSNPEIRNNVIICQHVLGKAAEVEARLADIGAEEERRAIRRLLTEWPPIARKTEGKEL